jgi:hypothetical protein
MQKVTKANPTIKTPTKGIAKNRMKGKAPPAMKMAKDMKDLKASETSGAQESGVKKKRMTAVASVKKPK